jgi:hypothetical protein
MKAYDIWHSKAVTHGNTSDFLAASSWVGTALGESALIEESH